MSRQQKPSPSDAGTLLSIVRSLAEVDRLPGVSLQGSGGQPGGEERLQLPALLQQLDGERGVVVKGVDDLAGETGVEGGKTAAWYW